MFSDWIWVQNVVFPLVGMGMATLFGVMIIKTVNKMVDRKAQKGISAAELEQIRASIQEVRAELGAEVAELQERLDFAERALVKGRGGPHRPADTPA